MENTKNYVFKRDGRKEVIHLDKITSRIQKLCYGLNMDYVDPVSITLKVIGGLYPGVTTVELDTLAAETAVLMSSFHPDYGVLAARIAISNLHKETKKHFADVIEALYVTGNAKTGKKLPIVSEKYYKIVKENSNRLNSAIIYDRDFSFDYFAFKYLEQNCLLKINGKTVERPQHMLMRVAIGIHGKDIDSAIETYNYMSEKYFIHSTSTLLRAATVEPYLCPSYILTMPDDSLEAIYDCITECGLIGSTGADLGVSIHNIRAKGTLIAGTNGVSNGLVPMLRVFNNSACFVEEKAESQAIYLEPWHPDILEFLNLKKFTGKEEYRAPELMYALWVPDLLMKRVKDNKLWSLMCPHNSQGLDNCWGEAFETLYQKYELEGKFVRQIPARDLWRAVCESQIETGAPFIVYKDSCNSKSNQKHLGTIKGAGLSTDIVAFTSPQEIAACPCASVALNMFVNSQGNNFDFDKLKKVVKSVAKDLDRIIDVSAYPLTKAKDGNLKHRPIAIGAHGLADTFILLHLAFDSSKAKLLNCQIFETIYYAALEASCELAEAQGPYETYADSSVRKGILQFDMWGIRPTNLWNWDLLKEKIVKFGIRNSLLTAVSSTSSYQIFGNNQTTEPYTSNITVRRVLSGEFQTVNQHLLKDLTKRGLWNDTMKNQIIDNYGSIQNISGIPDDLKELYKTVWEIPQKVIINMAADRGAFIDQSQAMNIHIADPSYGVMSSMHFYGWQQGLKTGMYHLKTKPSVNGIQSKTKLIAQKENGVIVNSCREEDADKLTPQEEAALVCSLQNLEACEMCSS